MSEQHTGPNTAYNAEVRRIAEVLAMAEYKKVKYTLISWEYLSEAALVNNYDFTGCDYRKQKSVLIDNKMEEAHAMVAEMEKAARLAYEHCDTEPVFNPIGIEQHLIERGLIPASAQEGGKDA
jgi:hypothetical protein